MPEEAMNVLEAIHLRRSCRSFKRERIPDDKLEMILESARWAPSPENRQNWRFIMIRDDQKLKDELAKLSVEASSAVYGGSPYDATADKLWYLPYRERATKVERMAGGSPDTSEYGYIRDADVTLIAICSFTHALAVASESGGGGLSEGPLTYYPLAMATQNIWLTATSLGLGVALNYFPLSRSKNIEWLKDVLGIPYGWNPKVIISIGVPTEPEVIAPPRFPLESIVYRERWGKPYRRLAFKGKE